MRLRNKTRRKPYMNTQTRTKTRTNTRTNIKRRLRGGTTIPFSELGGIFSGISNSFQNMISSFTVMPSAYNPPYNPSISKQFLMPPATQSLNQMYKASYN